MSPLAVLLWRFVWFRWFVISYCGRAWIGADWLASVTPLSEALRQFFLEEGDLAMAAKCARRVRH